MGYELKNGILYKDGVATIGLGTSYYASYHPEKVTVPEGGDKYGEMLLDVKDMASAGFNHVRLAANGEAHWEGDKFVLDTSFTDALIKELEKNDMFSFVRLQGYSMNYRNHKNVSPLNQYGESVSADGFVRDTLNDPELNADMDEITRQEAKYFSAFDSVLGHQIFNEPAMFARKEGGKKEKDLNQVFDYHPLSIKAWKEWLVEKGYRTKEEAEKMTPPIPTEPGEKDIELWGLWRQFGVENMSSMLSRLSECAREASPKTENFTNFIVSPLNGFATSCEGDWFCCAKKMGLVSVDIYVALRGDLYYDATLLLDNVESAAAVNGKHAWVMEFCCRTMMQAEDYEKEMITGLGCGYKGINYYLWRADLGGPEVQLGGMIWNNREKTEKYDKAVKFNHLINSLGTKIAPCNRVRDGVAILYSRHSMAQFATLTKEDSVWYKRTKEMYRNLKKAGLTVDFVEAENLKENPLRTKLLYIPDWNSLDEFEKAQVEDFAKDNLVIEYGNNIIPACGNSINGYGLRSTWCYRPTGTLDGFSVKPYAKFLLPEILTIAGVKPMFHASAKNDVIAAGYLENKNAEKPYYVACVTNIDSMLNPMENGQITVDEAQTGKVTQVVYHDREREMELEFASENKTCKIDIPRLEDVGGCILFIYVEKE